MSVPGPQTPHRNEPAWPRAAQLGLFAVANVPACVLLVWLVREATAASVGLAVAALTAGLIGNVLLFVRLTQDARRLREALDAAAERDRLRRVVEIAADAILTADERGIVRSCNPAASRLFGVRESDLIGRPVASLLPGAIGAADVGSGERVLGADAPLEARRQDGSRFPVSLAVGKSRRHGDDSSVLVLHDLTEINQTRHAAEAALRTKDSLLGRVSHELRTPIAGILGMVDLLRETRPGDDQAPRLDVIQESAEGLLHAFAQMIDHARLEAGQLELARESFSLRQTIEQALAPLTPLARARRIDLDVRVAAELPDQYLGDPVRLGQVLAALVGNAVKFTSSGEVVLKVRRAKQDPHRDRFALRPSSVGLSFEVSDTGVGIDPDKVARIFEPFEQGDTSSTRKHGGLGLGLSVASRLVRLMGGRIEVRSRPGKGSVFGFDLAFECGEATAHSVLVVLSCDDERRALEQHLTDWGMRPTGARTGRQALTELMRAVVEGSPFGLVLIEEHLPDLSAREVMHRLRDRGDVPLAVLLGRTEADVPLPGGIRTVVSRAATPAQIRQALARALALAGPAPAPLAVS